MRCSLLAVVFAAACGSGVPTPTETVCPVPDPNTLTYDNFGAQFMADYCTMCHSTTLARPQRNGAPLYHDFDSLLGVMQVHEHIDEQAGFGPAAENTFMPPESCPSVAGGPANTACRRPSADERRRLAEWISCEIQRPHTF